MIGLHVMFWVGLLVALAALFLAFVSTVVMFVEFLKREYDVAGGATITAVVLWLVFGILSWFLENGAADLYGWKL